MTLRAPHSTPLFAFAVAASFACACDNGRGTASSAPPASSGASASAPLVLAPRDGIHWTQVPDGVTDAASAIREALTRANADGRALLVYVGATWCEPCQRFHHAVDQGELDSAFPRLSILA